MTLFSRAHAIEGVHLVHVGNPCRHAEFLRHLFQGHVLWFDDRARQGL